MNSCLESQFPDDVFERYAMGKLLGQDSVPLMEHLPVCPECQARLIALEEYIRVVRTALTELASRSPVRISPQAALTL
jgi:hypothetical protein